MFITLFVCHSFSNSFIKFIRGKPFTILNFSFNSLNIEFFFLSLVSMEIAASFLNPENRIYLALRSLKSQGVLISIFYLPSTPAVEVFDQNK